MNEGYLTVFVTTANGTIPIEGALVHITQEGEETRLLRTNDSGKTEKIALSAPSPTASMSANQASPFYEYRIRVSKDGFYTAEVEHVPVFPNTSSVQPVDLVGISFYASDGLYPTDSVILVPDDPQVLDQKEEEMS